MDEETRPTEAVLLYDAEYEGYIRDPELPHSIYEIPGAREVAIEFRSYAKLAGFTGLRCGYVVVPKELVGKDAKGNPVELHRLWLRRQTTKFNGASYPIQVGAAACYTDSGRRETPANIDYYMENARIIRTAIGAAGLRVYGAENAPYAWIKPPAGAGSWEFFDRLLTKAHVVCTPLSPTWQKPTWRLTRMCSARSTVQSRILFREAPSGLRKRRRVHFSKGDAHYAIRSQLCH